MLLPPLLKKDLKILLKTYRGPKTFDLKENVDDTSIAKERHDPEEEKENAEKVGDQRVGWRKLAPL